MNLKNKFAFIRFTLPRVAIVEFSVSTCYEPV